MHLHCYADASGNALRISALHQAQQQVHFGAVSLKYVVRGTECYYSNQGIQAIQQGELLWGNGRTQAEVRIQSPIAVQGICIDLSAELLHQHADTLNLPNEARFWEWEALTYRMTPQGGHTWQALQTLHTDFDALSWNRLSIQASFFNALTQSVVLDWSQLHGRMQRIPSVKKTTALRLLQALEWVKNSMEQQPVSPMGIEAWAQQAGMSPFALIRLFKAAYGCSPHQYLLQLRLTKAQKGLQSGLGVTETAWQSGFADLAHFSKAYKKHFGYSPSQEICNF